jgi:hypothetical protein
MTLDLAFVDATSRGGARCVGVASPRTKKRADVRSVELCNGGIFRRGVEAVDRKRPGHNLDFGCAFTQNKGP